MGLDERTRIANEAYGDRLQELTKEMFDLCGAWMGLGIQRERLDEIKAEQVEIRKRVADRMRLYFAGEKNSDGAAVTAAPDHAHDQADGKFSGAGFFGFATNAPPQECPKISYDYLNSLGKELDSKIPSYGPGFRFSPQDREYLKKLRITLDDPAESGSM